MSMRWDDYNRYYKPGEVIPVEGGIKARSRRGRIVSEWWAKRWLEILDEIRKDNYQSGSNRMTNGKEYARKGQVIDINIGKGRITAKVQGTMPSPYNVSINIPVISYEDWVKIARKFSAQIYFAAKLAAGEMPKEIEEVFKNASLPLFPQPGEKIETKCACSDWSNPCKHLAAVYYLLAEELERNPFLLFRVRGIEREELINLIEIESGGLVNGGTAQDFNDMPGLIPENSQEIKAKPLNGDPEKFWRGSGKAEVKDFPSESDGENRKPDINADLPQRLGHFPFWRGTEPFLETLDIIYKRTSDKSLSLFSEKDF